MHKRIDHYITKGGDMELEIKKYFVKDVVFGSQSKYENHILHINKRDLINSILGDLKGYEIQIELARPGERTRIIHIMDTVKPSYRSKGHAFPGWLGDRHNGGEGIIHQLEGMTVMQTGQFPGIQEGIVDMTGKGSKYSIFSKKINLVLVTKLIDKEISKADFAYHTELMILRSAEYIAKLTRSCKEDKVDSYKLDPGRKKLPKIGYIYYIQAQGDLRNVHLYGQNCIDMEPTLLHPNEILGGGLVSANYIIACQKNPTYIHQENPVIKGLYERDGKELNFSCVILSTESSLMEKKEENARKIAQLALGLQLDGVIITQEGGGHADADLMMSLEECEKLGIDTVIQTNEIAGPVGDLPPLVTYSNMADAIVTNGNNDEVVLLDRVDRVIDGYEILNGKFKAKDSFETSLGILYTATNQVGINTMTTFMY